MVHVTKLCCDFYFTKKKTLKIGVYGDLVGCPNATIGLTIGQPVLNSHKWSSY